MLLASAEALKRLNIERAPLLCVEGDGFGDDLGETEGETLQELACDEVVDCAPSSPIAPCLSTHSCMGLVWCALSASIRKGCDHDPALG